MGKRPGGTTAAMVVVVEGAFRGRGWQGPTLLGSLRGVSVGLALWRPGGERRRCIWEQVLHAAYWKRTVLRVFDPASSATLLRTGSNWPPVPVHDGDEPGAAEAWRADVANLVALHGALVAAVERVEEGAWHRPLRRAGRAPMTLVQYAAGGAAHDAYHCGQVRLIKRDAVLAGVRR